MASRSSIATRVRRLAAGDLETVVRLDAAHTGTAKMEYWAEVFRSFVGTRRGHVALAAETEGRMTGYLLGEVRAFEFGSEPCGWIFAVGVDPAALRHGIASQLLDEALRRFRELGVQRVRTMVRRSDVPVLAFFRASGFAGGSFVQLERDLGPES
ncbi:MAG: GNAT family N-acetyltransferase [Planctomycetes bacterium]|nr:GNAT family N-acetyltransferase [Planctomycetota bacterium]